MANEYYYQSMGEVIGPLSKEEFKARASRGDILPDTLIRRGTGGDWVLAERLQGLLPGVPAVAAATPPGLPQINSNPADPGPWEKPPSSNVDSSRPSPKRNGTPPKRDSKKRRATDEGSLFDPEFQVFVTQRLIRSSYARSILLIVIAISIVSFRAIYLAILDLSFANIAEAIGWILGSIFVGLLLLLMLRLTLESVMVLFRIADDLRDIRDQNGQR